MESVNPDDGASAILLHIYISYDAPIYFDVKLSIIMYKRINI